MSKPIALTTDTFKSDVLDSGKTALVDFWAEWCGPCRMVGPVLDELAGEMDGTVFGKVNVDDQPELAAAYGVMSIPTLILFREGEEIGRLVGARPKEAIRDFINQ